MEFTSTSTTASLCLSSSMLPPKPFSMGHKLGPHHKSNQRSSTIVSASRNEAHGRDYYGGRLVDENLIVLRKRIHEMKMIERNYEPPAHWMGWEKNCYAGYDEFICEAMGLLQAQLMKTRPSLALGLAVLMGLSVSTSAAWVLGLFVEMTSGVLARIHLN
ncbi:hypothetical protein Acr_00g0024410 [Actinidia rufa]|uniref:Mediator of RNA polymerase II transcription subunit n=1 Tax=Actinidia rufa TaxID=165716 RepID=A0A7J0DD36_9ERIC|nr:hypothetical protein Acr_00g0024410 [Actinidia rufa]